MADRENFTKRIAVEQDFTPEFFFNRVHTTTGQRYYISVLDKDRNNYLFTMEQQGDSWKITSSSKLPDWIKGIEKKLEDAILENTKR